MPEITIRPAAESEIGVIDALLRENELPTAGVRDHWRTFLIALDGETVVGCGGAEAYTSAALIRSIAVAPDHRSRGIARMIVRQLIDRLASRGIRDFYLLTTTAESYFRKRGFKKIDRDRVHPQLLSSAEFQGACPSTAVCMRMEMLT